MNVIGFTLFWHPEKKKWQRSVRHEGETGWIIDHISEHDAKILLRGMYLVNCVVEAKSLRAEFSEVLRNDLA